MITLTTGNVTLKSKRNYATTKPYVTIKRFKSNLSEIIYSTENLDDADSFDEMVDELDEFDIKILKIF